MSSESEQAAVQAASDGYVVAHCQGVLLSEDVTHQCGLELYRYIWLW